MPWAAAKDALLERHEIRLFEAQSPDSTVSDRSFQSSENSAQGPSPLPQCSRDYVAAVAANAGSARTNTVDLCPQLAASGEEGFIYPTQTQGLDFSSKMHVVRPGAARYAGAFHLKLDDEALQAVRRQLTTGSLPAEGAGLSPRPGASVLTSAGVPLAASTKPVREHREEQEWDGSVANEDLRMTHSPPHSGSSGSSEDWYEASGSLETPREGHVARECSSVSVEGTGWRRGGPWGPSSRAGLQRQRFEPVSPPWTFAHASNPSKPSRGLLRAAEVTGTSAVKGLAYRPPGAIARLRCPTLCLWRRGNTPRADGLAGGANGGCDAVRGPISPGTVANKGHPSDDNDPAAQAKASNSAAVAASTALATDFEGGASHSSNAAWDTPSMRYLADVRHWLEEVEELQRQLSDAASDSVTSRNVQISPSAAVVSGQTDPQVDHLPSGVALL